MDEPGDPIRRRRRLAAILMADVVGFTRLMGLDDEGTTSRIIDFHQKMRATIEWHGGRVVGTAGDSVFGEFDSILQALDCAAEIQLNLHNANEGIPADQRIEVRIGLHLGDVIVEEYNVFGDGVNIASRLEALADPGGIVLSEAVYQQVKGRRDLPITEMGTRTLKNVEHPVRLYRIGPEAFGGEPPSGSSGQPPPPPGGGRRWKVWAGVAAVVVVGGIGALAGILLSGDDEAPATTVGPTTTTTSTSTSTTTTTTSTTTTTTTLPLPAGAYQPSLENLPPAPLPDSDGVSGSGCVVGSSPLWDGPWYGFVEEMASGSVEFDLACFFAGDRAQEEAEADGNPLTSPYYVRNTNTRLKTLDLHPGAVVFVRDPGTGAYVGIYPAAWSSPGCPGETCGVWIYINGGVVTAMVEFAEG